MSWGGTRGPKSPHPTRPDRGSEPLEAYGCWHPRVHPTLLTYRGEHAGSPPVGRLAVGGAGEVGTRVRLGPPAPLPPDPVPLVPPFPAVEGSRTSGTSGPDVPRLDPPEKGPEPSRHTSSTGPLCARHPPQTKVLCLQGPRSHTPVPRPLYYSYPDTVKSPKGQPRKSRTLNHCRGVSQFTNLQTRDKYVDGSAKSHKT